MPGTPAAIMLDAAEEGETVVELPGEDDTVRFAAPILATAIDTGAKTITISGSRKFESYDVTPKDGSHASPATTTAIPSTQLGPKRVEGVEPDLDTVKNAVVRLAGTTLPLKC